MCEVLISIIIPVYNAADTINRTLHSLTDNTYSIEVICVDDGSNDKSFDVINRTKQYDNRIKLIKQKNMGASAARNYGLSIASGKYIMFCDADDELERNALDYIVEDLKYYEPEYLVFRRKTLYPDGHYDDWLNGDNKRNLFFCDRIEYFNKIIETRKHSVVVYNRVYKHSIITEHNIKFDNKLELGEDILFNFIYCKYIKLIVEDGRAVYLQHKVDGSLTTKERPDFFKMNTRVIPFIIREMGGDSYSIQPFIDRLYLKSADKAVFRALNKKDAKHYKEMINIINSVTADSVFLCVYKRFNFELHPVLKKRLTLIKDNRIASYYIRYVILPQIKKRCMYLVNYYYKR